MSLPLEVEISPEEREQIARAFGRILGLIMRSLDLPWWGATLVFLTGAALFAALLAYADRAFGCARNRRRSRP